MKIILLMLLCFSLRAADSYSEWFSNGRFTPENDSQKMTNGYGARLDFTDDAGFLNNWRQHWKSVSTIKHDAGIYVVVFFANFSEMLHFDRDYDFNITVRKPDGTVCVRTKNFAVTPWPGPATGPIDDAMLISLSPHFVVVQIDPPDPYGTYAVEVVLRDELKKTELKLRKEFVVEK